MANDDGFVGTLALVALVILALSAFNVGPFSLDTPDATIQVAEGSTVNLPYVYNFDYDASWFGTSPDIRIFIEYKDASYQDEVLGTFTVDGEGIYEGTVPWTVKGSAGDSYKLKMLAEIESKNGYTEDIGSAIITVNVVEAGSEEDIPDITIGDDGILATIMSFFTGIIAMLKGLIGLG